MTRIALFALAIALPVVATAQDMNQTGSIPPAAQADAMTEPRLRRRLTAEGYTSIGTIELDSEGIWRTTAMKGDTMMSVSVTRDGTIEDR